MISDSSPPVAVASMVLSKLHVDVDGKGEGEVEVRWCYGIRDMFPEGIHFQLNI